MIQREIHAYDLEGNYQGIHVATDAQFTVKEGLVEGIAPVYSQMELDAKEAAIIDSLVNEIDNGKSLLRSLGTEVFLLAKAADPTLTPAQFKNRIWLRVANYDS